MCAAGRNVNWCSHYGKKVWRFLKKLKIELTYDPEIPKEAKSLSRRDICTPEFTALLLVREKIWK